MNLKKGSISLMMMILLCSVCYGLDVEYEEGIHLIRPPSKYITSDYSVQEYLSVEDLVFVSCLENKELTLRPSVMCLDNNNFEDLIPYPWTDDQNCYIASFNLDTFECNNIRLQAEYTLHGENYRLYRDLRVNRFTNVLDTILETQYSDGGWKSTRDTAYGIWALSHFDDLFAFEIDQALEWLKLERNDNLKCWPKAPCNIPLTLEMLYVLTRSGFDDAKRVVNDAQNWIENRQYYYQQGDRWSIEITSRSDNTIFTLIAKNRDLFDTDFELNTSMTKRFTFEARMNDTIYVISPQNFEAVIRNQYGRETYSFFGSNLSYVVPGACWSANNIGDPCNTFSTALASLLDLHDPNQREAKRWMFSKLEYGDDVGVYYGDSLGPIETALFISSMNKVLANSTYHDWLDDYVPYMVRYTYIDDTKDHYARYIKEAVNWLLFRQNNEGSWGLQNGSASYKAPYTAYSVLALSDYGFNRTAEPIEDAERWLSLNEGFISINDTVALGSAFYVLRKNARPLLNTNPRIIQMKNVQEEILIFNPTPFNFERLRYNFTDGLDAYISIEERETISSYSYRRLTLRKIGSPQKDMFGYLEISNMGDTVARIPVIIQDFPSINVSAQSSLTVFGRSGSVRLSVSKSGHDFTCSVDWDNPDISSPSSFRLSSSTHQLQVTFDVAQSTEDLYTGELRCTAKGYDYSMPLSVYITRFSSYPLTLEPSQIYVNSSEQAISFVIRNNLDRTIRPEISIDDPFFIAVGEISLGPNEEREVPVQNLLVADMNYTASFRILVRVFDQAEEIPVIADVVVEPPPKPNLIMPIIILSLVLIILSVAGYAGYRFREEIVAYANKFNAVKMRQEIKKNISELDSLKQKEKANSIINLIELMRFQEKPDKDIRAELKKHFTNQEIESALDQGNITLQGGEEE